MDRERLLIGLWAMASACWICLVLLGAAADSAQQARQATVLFALAPPILTMVSGYLIARVMRAPIERTGGSDRPGPSAGTVIVPPAVKRTAKPILQDP